MTPPPAATIAGRRPAATKRRAPASRGPSRAPSRALGPKPAQAQRAVALPRPLVVRLPRFSLRAIPSAIPARRLLGGRGVIAVLGGLLLGLVFLQVSLLKLNTAISVNVERAGQLERDNAQARATVSKLDAGRRIQDAAGQLGMIMPAAGSICFLAAERGGPCSGGDAAQAGSGLDPAADVAALAGPAGTAGDGSAAGATGTATQQPDPAQVAPVGQTVPGGGTSPSPATATPQTGATTAPARQPVTTAPVQTGQAAPATQPSPVTTTAAGVTGGVAAGTGG